MSIFVESSQHWEIKSYGNAQTIGMPEKSATLNTNGMEDNKSLPSNTKLILKVIKDVFHFFHLTESLHQRSIILTSFLSLFNLCNWKSFSPEKLKVLMLKQQTDISFTTDFKIFKNPVHDQTNSSLIEKKWSIAIYLQIFYAKKLRKSVL